MRALPIVLGLAFILAGCTHTVYVTGRAGAPSGQATTMTAGRSSGELTLPLGGKVYSGRWVYVPQGGSIGLMSGTAWGSRGGSAMMTATALNAPMGGGGSIVLSDASGGSFRCAFGFSEWSSTGAGECQDDEGRSYDLQITR